MNSARNGKLLSDVGFRQSEFSLLKTPVMFVCCRTSDPEIRELDRALQLTTALKY